MSSESLQDGGAVDPTLSGLLPWRSVFPLIHALAELSPQTVLLEGGTETGRFDTALFLAILMNMENSSFREEDLSSVLKSRLFNQIRHLENPDLFVYDGKISNRQDDEEPGIIRALTIDNMRSLKVAAGSPPAHLKKRMVIFQGITQTREEAINSLLKIVEEHVSHTCFIFLTPQREQLLPTIVSRSICITLPWSGKESNDPAPLEKSFIQFIKTGQGFLPLLSQKNGVDLAKAEALLLNCLHALAEARKKSGASAQDLNNELVQIMSRLKEPEKLIRLQFWIEEALEMLRATVNPARCMEAFSTRFYQLLNPR